MYYNTESTFDGEIPGKNYPTKKPWISTHYVHTNNYYITFSTLKK